MTAVVLALCTSVVWGSADFLGGSFSRRLPLASVALVTQTGALVTALAALAIFGGLDAGAVGLGLAGGCFGAVGLLAYYRALSVGTMGVVAPISATSAVVPLAVGLASGERPSQLRLAGALVAFAGAVLASVQEHRRGGASRDSVLLALLTALCFGGLLTLLGKGSDLGGPVAALLGSRLSTFVLLVAWVALVRPELTLPGRRTAAVLLGAGALSASANGLFALATQHGLLSIVSLLTSIYPVTTVALAAALLGERLNRVQAAGVAVVFAGVALVAVG